MRVTDLPPLHVIPGLGEVEALEEVQQQLLRRPAVPPEQWASSPQAAQLAREIGSVIAGVSGWPEGRFAPQDPMAMLLIEDMVDIDVVSVLERLDVPIELDEIYEMMRLPFGEFLEQMAHRQRAGA